jgi:putative transposase
MEVTDNRIGDTPVVPALPDQIPADEKIVSVRGDGVIPHKKSACRSRILYLRHRKLYMKTSRFTDSQIIAILKQAEAGSPVPELCREHGISNATFYKWRSKFGGMDASLMARMKELEEENRRLKKMYVEERLKAEIVAEALTKKW